MKRPISDLISGLFQLKKHQQETHDVSVVILSLEQSDIENPNFFKEIHFEFSLTEKIEIGLSLKRRHQQSENKHSGEQAIRFRPKRCPKRDKKEERHDELLAQWLGLDSKSNYNRLEQVYFKGIPALLEAVNAKNISIFKAYKLSKSSEIEQAQSIQSFVKEGVVT